MPLPTWNWLTRRRGISQPSPANSRHATRWLPVWDAPTWCAKPEEAIVHEPAIMGTNGPQRTQFRLFSARLAVGQRGLPELTTVGQVGSATAVSHVALQV